MKLAVLLPCYNEEAAIAKVVEDFRTHLPDAEIYVYDNNSTDRTSDVARASGAHVGFEILKGKGNVVRRMFADIDADIYLMADGDGTYDSSVAPELIKELVDNNLDMIVGTRDQEESTEVYRSGHRTGNRLLNLAVQILFDRGFTDMLSGYRVFSRRFVKTFPSESRGFEIETEMTIHALQLRLPIKEIPTRYFTRAEGTESKLSTWRDGFRILNFIMYFFKEGKPFWFFGLISLALAVLSLIIGVPVIADYFDTGLVERFPTAMLSMGIMLCALISFVCGTILDTVARGRLEHKRLRYLQFTPVQAQK